MQGGFKVAEIDCSFTASSSQLRNVYIYLEIINKFVSFVRLNGIIRVEETVSLVAPLPSRFVSIALLAVIIDQPASAVLLVSVGAN